MFDKIIKIIHRIRPAASSLSPQTRLIEDVGLDSLGLLEFSALVEDQFSVVLEGRHLNSVRTIGDVCALVAELVASAGAGPESSRGPSSREMEAS
jgi:acyl carrier protein